MPCGKYSCVLVLRYRAGGGGGDREAFILLGQSYARSPSEVAFSLGQARQPFSSMKDDNMFIADKVYAYRQLGFYEKFRSLQGDLKAFIFLTSTNN